MDDPIDGKHSSRNESRDGYLSPEGLTRTQEELCRQLFAAGCVRFGEFKLKVHDEHPETPLSPIYLNLRTLQRHPEAGGAKQAAVNAYVELLRDLKFDLIVGVPEGATPITSSIADRTGIGQITPREKKAHGISVSADGYNESEDRGLTAVVIEDLVTTGKSTSEMIEKLKQLGLVVTDIVILVDREQGGRENLAAAGYTLHSAMTMGQMLDFYRREKIIPEEEYQRILDGVEAMNEYLNRMKYPTPDAITDLLSRVIAGANERLHEPIFDLYQRMEFEDHLDLEGSYIQSLDVDPLQVKDIEQNHIKLVYSHFMALGSTIHAELTHGGMTAERWRELSKFTFLMVSTAAILDIARQRHRSPINLAAAYKAIKKIYEEELGSYFTPLTQEEELEVIDKAYKQAFKLIHKDGFTVIGEKE